MSSCSLKWYSPASSSGHWWPVRVALPRDPPSPASCLYSRRTWLPKIAYWKWGRIYRRTTFPVWWFQECKHRTMDFMTKSTTESFLWLPNFRKSHHLSATWKMSVLGVGTALDMIFGTLVFREKQEVPGHPFSGFSRVFREKSEVEGFTKSVKLSLPVIWNSTFFFFLKNGSLAGIFVQLINCDEVQVPKKTAWNIFRVWMRQWLIYFPTSWRLAWPMPTITIYHSCILCLIRRMWCPCLRMSTNCA